MVRLSKQKQDKLEHIMSLVEQLGVDRVLGRLRQTRMMSKEILDDMTEWETDYEKRVALLGFLVSPEGKRAFGALYELAKVHEEQLKLQEEQEKLRQEQLAQQANSEHRRSLGGKGQANMKHKMRAQMAKRKPQASVPKTPAPEQSTGNSQLNGADGIAPLQITPVSKPERKSSLVPKLKTTPDQPKQEVVTKQTTTDQNEVNEKKDLQKESNSKPPTPDVVKITSPVPSHHSQEENHHESVTISQFDTNHVNEKNNLQHQTSSGSFYSSPPARRGNTMVIHSKALDDYSAAKNAAAAQNSTDGQWGKESSQDDNYEEDVITAERPPPEGENAEDTMSNLHQTTDGDASETDLPERSQSASSKRRRSAKSSDSKDQEPSRPPSPESPLKSKLNEIYHSLSKFEVTVDQLTMDDIKDIIGDWQSMRKDAAKERETMNKEVLHAKEELRKAMEEKDKMRKEKDKYVFKEFELQQKFQDLTQKHRSLREDHEVMKQGNHQQQQSTKKNNKIHQDLRKKLAKLETKLKSMDKQTAKKSTQTQEIYEKDVYEAKRTAEESLMVAQCELKEATSKVKSLSQENEDLKKQINAKGREINKRERKARKDEENVRLVSRERDSLENKLRKVTEQLEYYRGMMDIRSKGAKRPTPEKKEVRVQRCSSGRHILVKTTTGTAVHAHEDQNADDNSNRRNSSQNGTNSNSTSNTNKPARPGAATVRGQTNKKTYVNANNTSEKSKISTNSSNNAEKPKTNSNSSSDKSKNYVNSSSSGDKISLENSSPPIHGILKNSSSKSKDSSVKIQTDNNKTATNQKPKSEGTAGNKIVVVSTKFSQKSKSQNRENGDLNSNSKLSNPTSKSNTTNGQISKSVSIAKPSTKSVSSPEMLRQSKEAPKPDDKQLLNLKTSTIQSSSKAKV